MVPRVASLLEHTAQGPAKPHGWGDAGAHVPAPACGGRFPSASHVKGSNSTCGSQPWSFRRGSCLGVFALVLWARSGHPAKARVSEADGGAPPGVGAGRESNADTLPTISKVIHKVRVRVDSAKCTQIRQPTREKRNNDACWRSWGRIRA